MRSRAWCFAATLLILSPLAAQYRTALPGYRYEFPRDHFNHPDYQTEWWYYTGNLKSADGHRYGFELTFFRQAVRRDAAMATVWDLRDLYLAHLALSDLDGGKFYHTERVNRAGPDIAAVSESLGRVWNGNWRTQWEGSNQRLVAIDARFQFLDAGRSCDRCRNDCRILKWRILELRANLFLGRIRRFNQVNFGEGDDDSPHPEKNQNL